MRPLRLAFPGPVWAIDSLVLDHHHRQSLHAAQQSSDLAASIPAECLYWLDQVPHRGVAAFNPTADYQVYRNVKLYGAKGDGITDDTAAINLAISDGYRISPQDGNSSTTALAVVYFPAGEYVVSSSIVDYYYTQLVGNPNCLPVLKASANFTGLGVIDGDQYGAGGLGYSPATKVFYRQVRNFIIDLTSIPANKSATGIHWPTAQATSLQNIVIKMSKAQATQHQGVLIEEGSAGFISDLIFHGGRNGLNIGNQQYTLRNLTFYNTVAAINQLWGWGITYKGLAIYGCTIGINMTSGGAHAQTVAGVVVIDSVIANTKVAFATARSASSQPPASGSLVLENVELTAVAHAVTGSNSQIILKGTTSTKLIKAWAQGHEYTPDGSRHISQFIDPNVPPSGLVGPRGNYYQQAKPQYEGLSVHQIACARDYGAVGNGIADDTLALQAAVNDAASTGKLLFLDHGTYKVTSTIHIPPAALITGEGYSVVMSSGDYFTDMSAPKAVIQVGRAGQTGRVELSNLILSTQSNATTGKGQGGALLLEWNLASSPSHPSGMWDVHTRLGGFIGSNQQGDACIKLPERNYTDASQIPNLDRCTVAFQSMHITKSAASIYVENSWLWAADHDIDFFPANSSQVAVFAGRGLLVESTDGNIWLYAAASEHHTLYQYQLSSTQNVFMGQIQTETAYYQPFPPAPIPFRSEPSLKDPIFTNHTFLANGNSTAPNADGWGLRVVGCKGWSSILAYGVGLYSFFNNWSTTCSSQGSGAICQSRILDIDETSKLSVYDLHTVGTNQAVRQGDRDYGYYADNSAGFSTEIAVLRTG